MENLFVEKIRKSGKSLEISTRTWKAERRQKHLRGKKTQNLEIWKSCLCFYPQKNSLKSDNRTPSLLSTGQYQFSIVVRNQIPVEARNVEKFLGTWGSDGREKVSKIKIKFFKISRLVLNENKTNQQQKCFTVIESRTSWNLFKSSKWKRQRIFCWSLPPLYLGAGAAIHKK